VANYRQPEFQVLLNAIGIWQIMICQSVDCGIQNLIQSETGFGF
jgi:hypothetical protein